MKNRSHNPFAKSFWLPVMLLALPGISVAQVPVDEDGNPLGTYQTDTSASASNAVIEGDDIPLLSATELQELVGPIALYPDDLLAIVLPASTYPLQVVQAERFLDDLEDNPSLSPDEAWDDSIVALTNYPEVVELLNDDLDWTWRLGEAVVAQQADVIAAVETFRDRAYAAGNLKSDSHQTVSQSEGVIEITPVEDDVIYVPYYEPERVIVYQSRPAYHYYPRAYPVYYYPYHSGYAFNHGYFWGVTTAFSVGWYTNRLHVFHHSYNGHPYFGHSYWNNRWYRRPSIHVHNNHYGSRYGHHFSNRRYRSGDYWHPQTRRTVRSDNQRITRTRYYPNANATHARNDPAQIRNNFAAPQRINSSGSRRSGERQRDDARSEIRFRERADTGVNRNRNSRAIPNTNRGTNNSSNRAQPTRPNNSRRNESRSDNQFRDRPERGQSRDRSSQFVPKIERRVPNASDRSDRIQARRQSSQPRQSQPRTSVTRPNQTRSKEPRQSQSRQRPSRRSQARQSQPRQSQARQSQPRQSQARQSQPRQSQPRQSQPRQKQSRASAPKQVASNSGKRESSNSGRRDSNRGQRRR